MRTQKTHDPLFECTSKAFDIFFSDDVVIEHVSENSEKRAYHVKAYVCDDGIELTEGEITKDVELWSIAIQLDSWTYNTLPQIGDDVTFVNGEKTKWKISRVVKADDTLQCFCRSR